ncbi:hypothetical protein PV328_000205 [Microctonus aethiopoides]|uniref:Cordon-bleu protein-like 1 n=1 Tax=Microctonus aethiopoides TaxID=144406 RepID=A0AA39FUZ4_9HYME|nr:hypothetical protein PV328_000205 [Microctonus aethiopoides]
MKMGFKLKNWFRRHRSREEKITGMVLTVTEDTPADMLAGSMELLVQLPRDHHIHTQRVTVERSTAMMDLLVQIATAHKLAASSYTLQAIGEHGLVLPHQSNTPIGALDALEVKLLPKQGTFIPRKTKLASQPFETTFRLQVHLPRNQLYVSRVSPKTNLGDILEDVCREKNLDKNKYELRHPGNHKETLDLSLSLQDYHLQEVTLYAKQGQSLGSALSSQDIMALQRQEERRRQQAKQSVFGFIFKKSKESSLSTDSLGGRSVSPARSDETGRSISPLAPPTRPQRKRRPAPNPPTVIHQTTISPQTNSDGVKDDDSKEKLVISHSRNSSDSSGYHEASVLSDNPESAGRMPETLPRRSRPPSKFESRKLAQTSQTSKSLCNLATSSGGGLTHAISNTSLSSTGIRKKRAAPKPPISRPLSSAISTQALERIVDSEESLTSDMGISKPPSDIAGSSGTEMNSKANSDIAMSVHASTKLVAKNFCHTSQLEMNNDGKRQTVAKLDDETCRIDVPKAEKNISTSIEDAKKVERARVAPQGVDDSPTETDLLLQKVSTTLANVSPISERLSQDVPSNEVNHVEKMDRVNSKADKAPAHDETGLDSTPNMTLNSQQDTSDYVSATGEDLSATDWEYQLPDPPSAFRDNIAPDHDDYETITLRSVDAFKEPIVTIINSTEKDFNRQVNVQNEPEHLMQPDTRTTIPAIITTTSTMTHLINEKCDEKNINIKEINGDMNTPRLSLENHKKDSNNELKKEVISELENKIENGIFNPPNRKYSDEEFNQSCVDKLAPNIAPIENTLPNFTITTYPRQKNLNIYDSSVSMSSSHLTDSTQDRIVKTFATLSRNTSALSRKKESYTDSSNHNHRQGNNFEINNSPIIRATSIQHINLSSEGLKNPIEETIKVPQRHQDTANSNDKTNIVHRSKSYIVLSHNSKYRSNKTLVSNIIDDKSMIKSTSVTNLNQDTSAIDKEKSRNQEKDLKNFHNEKNENRELQSVQVLKSILPQLKDTQHTDKSASEISVTEHYNEEKILATKSDETDEVQMRNKTEAQTERNKSESDETIKRWRYTGPPAISLGSWSERPCLNVKIKMDTDYKFSVNNNNINHYSNSNNINNNSNNNNNTTGAKTIVNLNSSSNDVDIVNYKDSFIKNLPKNHVKNDNVKLSSNDTKESDVKRVMDDVGIMKKKITNTSLNQMQSGLKNFDFVKLRMRSRDESDKPVVVTNVAVKKSYAEKPELKDDDIKIDTRPVNFKALTQAFGQVNLRAIPKHNSQNRHSDYFDARQNDNDFVDNKFMKRQTNIIAGEINRPPIKRYTSVIGIDAQPSINNFKKINEDIKKIHSTTTKVNGPAPIVKGFHINHPNKTSQISNSTTIQKNSFTLNNKINGHVPPPPPTMPVITGVTLKSNNAAPKSMSTCKDPRDQLLESIRNYGRDKLKNVNTVS